MWQEISDILPALLHVKRDLACVKRDLACVKRDLVCVKKDVDMYRRYADRIGDMRDIACAPAGSACWGLLSLERIDAYTCHRRTFILEPHIHTRDTPALPQAARAGGSRAH